MPALEFPALDEDLVEFEELVDFVPVLSQETKSILQRPKVRKARNPVISLSYGVKCGPHA